MQLRAGTNLKTLPCWCIEVLAWSFNIWVLRVGMTLQRKMMNLQERRELTNVTTAENVSALKLNLIIRTLFL